MRRRRIVLALALGTVAAAIAAWGVHAWRSPAPPVEVSLERLDHYGHVPPFAESTATTSSVTSP